MATNVSANQFFRAPGASCYGLCLVLSLIGCATDEPGEVDKRSFEQQLIDTNLTISQEIDRAAQKLDLYVANKKFVDEPNRSRLSLHNAFSFTEGGVREYSPHASIRLHLPNLQEKLQLRFTSYDEDREDRGINDSRYQPPTTETKYTGSLAFFQDLGKVHTEFRPLVEFSNDVQSSYLFKFSSDAKRGAFTIEPEFQLFARSDSGTGQFLRLNPEFELTPSNWLTIVNEEEYTDGDNTLRTNHGLDWDHQYNKAMSHQHALIFESTNRETYHLDQYVFSSTFKHKLYNNILHYSVTPYLTMAKAMLFHPRASFDFKFEIIF